MAQNFDLASLLAEIQQPVKRSVFLSYHHGGDQAYYDAFTQAFDDTYDILFDNSLERQIDSDNVNYVLQRIRDAYVKGSSCTIVLCGAETPWRKYVDWEIKATLDMEHGLKGFDCNCLSRCKTMKTLARQKLDVVNKTRSNIFGWRGQFTPEFILVSSNP